MQVFLLNRAASEVDRDLSIRRVQGHLRDCSLAKGWRVEVTEQKSRRSDAQNAYLWGVVYPTILDAGQLEGWEAADLHEYFLGEHFGWEVIEGFGRKRQRPIRRSSRLNKTEFGEYVAFIQRRAAELGIVIQDPEPRHE